MLAADTPAATTDSRIAASRAAGVGSERHALLLMPTMSVGFTSRCHAAEAEGVCISVFVASSSIARRTPALTEPSGPTTSGRRIRTTRLFAGRSDA